MRRRTTIAGTAPGPGLTVICAAVLAVLASLVLSACTSGPSSSPPPVTLTPTITGGTATATVTASSAASNATATVTAPASAAATITVTQTATASPAPTTTITQQVPSGAPITGGGGTAGLQDGLLFALGGAAVLAGIAAIAYRRRLTRNR